MGAAAKYNKEKQAAAAAGGGGGEGEGALLADACAARHSTPLANPLHTTRRICVASAVHP